MNYLEEWGKMQHSDTDKYRLEEYILAYNNLPAGVTKTIPKCVFDDHDRINGEVVRVLAWVMARRSKADITLEEVGRLINDANLVQVIRDIYYFWTSLTREEQEEQIKAAEQMDQQEVKEVTEENPLA